VDQSEMLRGMRRRDFVRASAGASLGVMTAGGLLKAADAVAAGPGGAEGPGIAGPYVGAGSTAAIRPFPLTQVALGPGLLKEKQDRMVSFARGYDERRFLVLFNQLANRPNPPGVNAPGGWEDGGLLSGHWTGHYMTMLAQAAAAGYTDLRDKLEWVVNELGECQDALADQGLTVHPGYLGCKPEDTVLRIGPPRFAVYGSNQNTNSWAPWYTQHKIIRGFLDAYTLAGLDRALEIVLKMAEWAFLALTLGDVMHPNYSGPPTRSDLNYMWDTYIAGELGGINEVMAEIAALTDDRRFLEIARKFDNRESLFGACLENRDILVCAPGTQPGRRRPPRLHANQHVPNFTGYMRIYEQSGDEQYHTVAKNFWAMIVPHRMFSHGGTSGNYPGSNDNIEQLQNRDNIANAIAAGGAESCTTYNVVKLARNLFLHDPDPKYMDYVERGHFNQIAGTRQDTNTNSSPNVTYFQPLTPGSRRSYGNTGTCCGGTGMENHLKHQETVFFHSADHTELWVNLFIPSTLNWTQREFTVVQETDFPRSQSTKLTLNGNGRVNVKLRVPGWATKGYTVKLNGQTQSLDAEPSSYVSIDRVWSPGDTIEIAFPFPIRIERAIDRPDTQTVMYGPLAYPVLGSVPAGQFQQLTLYKYLKRDGDYGRAAITNGTGVNLTAGGLTLRPQYVGDTQAQSMYFRRVEPEIVFGSIGTGVPNVKRDDDLPNYDVPVTGITSPGDDGLTFLDIVWDKAPFANHGAFVSTVTDTANAFVDAGLLTPQQRATVVAAAASAEEELRP
jgi:DUF1680 family protein